jgi:hypothetical protein
VKLDKILREEINASAEEAAAICEYLLSLSKNFEYVNLELIQPKKRLQSSRRSRPQSAICNEYYQTEVVECKPILASDNQ